MHLRTLLLLIVLVGGLVALALWQLEREEAGTAATERTLVTDLSGDAVEVVRVDSLERGLQLRLERDADHGWALTDPLAYPADVSLVGQLLDTLIRHPAQPWEGDAAALGLRPPRAVVEIESPTSAGTRLHRIELGAVDVDRQHVFARVDGQLLRTTATLDTVLALPLPEWRRREILPDVSPLQVLSLTRTGTFVVPDGRELDLRLEALRTEVWSATQPFVAQLGPEAFGTLLSSLCALRAAGFEDDAPGPLEHYGLEPPDFRIEITTLSGEAIALRFAQQPRDERLLCLREGSAHVYSIAPETMVWLMAPAETLVDLELARTTRDRVERVRLVADGTETVIERQGFGWEVRAEGGEEPLLAPTQADPERVSDLLGRIERTRLAEVLPGVEFEPGEAPAGIYVETRDRTLGGEIGASYDSERGTRGLLFRRPGETLVGLLEEDLLEVARIDPRSLRSDELHKVPELEVAQVRLVAEWAGARRTWGRDERGRWIPEGSTAEARDFARLVDRILTVRAERLLEPAEEPEGTQPVVVALIDRGGATRQAFVLQRLSGLEETPGAAGALYRSGGRRAVVDGELYEALRGLLGLE
jgi:hypothetical protein